MIVAITTRLFGKSGPVVAQAGLGVEGVLRAYGREQEAKAVIDLAQYLSSSHWRQRRR